MFDFQAYKNFFFFNLRARKFRFPKCKGKLFLRKYKRFLQSEFF